MSGLDEQAAPEVDAISVADLVRDVALALHDGDTQRAAQLVVGLRPRDLADVIELLSPEHRIALIQALGPAFDYEVLSEIDETVRDQLSEALPNELLAKAVTELDTDDAAYLIENLEQADRDEILAQVPKGDRLALERQLEYPEESAGRLMQSDFVAVAPYWTTEQVIEHARETDDLPDTFSEIFVVDPAFRVLGSVDLSRLLRTKRDVPVSEIMETDLNVVLDTSDQEEVARQFERYGLISAPVVDQNNKLVGVITVDDVVEVLQDEADEDMKALGGVGDESLTDSVVQTARSRVPWLIINLGTAVLASFVIKAFDATIEQMVALAVLMPIVASMGGNAGTQTMTVTVRALATNKLGAANSQRIISRETLVGLLNGLILSVIMATIVFLWFGSGRLGAVIGMAMVVNLLAAALAGILIPLALDRLKLDPAPASGVFVTMVTDCVGFFAFLGLASLILL
ncbi:MAG: magnesium transporter [Hyphomicrobium zavarzinii]|jgi:magnesium transporter|uniref:magnesium transporter n=1 Tax=Hyphomicrobium TaxID=81 RepID=UPI00035E864B|nr:MULTISPECIES: magnesium transporter [Hyphomicrobium]MBL8845365.1 magnesium transporter [Hyphomicrobium zavarzinii]WBT40229.1 magnesium transporter [Hyphomicrobium sp. DMF-1]HML44139.1 magnesium transporter [Hyphomicrobium zavarzinii]